MGVAAEPETVPMAAWASASDDDGGSTVFPRNSSNALGRPACDHPAIDLRAGIAGDIDCASDGGSDTALRRCRYGDRDRE